MSDIPGSGVGLDQVLHALQERAKELSCLYRIEELVSAADRPLDELLRAVLLAIPPGWQYPGACEARIVIRDRSYKTPGLVETLWSQGAPIVVHGAPVGSVTVYYSREMPPADEGPFLREERKLIDTIAERLGQLVRQREDRETSPARPLPAAGGMPGLDVILDLLHGTDRNLYQRVARKTLNHLVWGGSEQARELLKRLAGGRTADSAVDDNRPLERSAPEDVDAIASETFRIARQRLSEHELVSLVQVWIREDRVDFLVQALETPYTSLVEIGNALERFQRTGVASRDLSLATQIGITTALVRRLLTDQLDFINTARRFVAVEDFVKLIGRIVLLPRSHGRLGGKASGLFLAAQIVMRSPESAGLLANVRIPKTWYLPSDGILHFIAFNDLDDVYAWKYRDIDQIRQEYPHILQLFKNARFPPEIINGVSQALDDLGDRPLIVRSSSLLEDRVGSAFSGKYKSLFLANQGDKRARLSALLDAIAEVYASTFSPDPIQYRSERGLLEHHEEMAVMIQEVVGVRVGHYFLPSFSGVGFSNNEFRWSARIKRQDGLLRLVPGLGTRAVDRLADDYPVLVAPGQPGLRVNATPEEVVRYSPKKIDVIDLERNDFATLELRELLRQAGDAYPGLQQLVSVLEHGHLRPAGFAFDPTRDDLVFNLEGLMTATPFLTRMRTLLSLLRDAIGTPVDIEFASDGKDIYLVQCRPQSSSPEDAPAPIPRDIPQDKLLFSASRHVSNGTVPDITHVVYVDPDGYTRLASLGELRDVGRAVGALNKLLPKRQFLLMGPGRWGSRGDIRLGVGVTYADINNAAVLVEIARKQGNYVPDLSFGTHFFQDLVEAQIRYLPLYPDDPGVAFKEAFLRGAPSLLKELLPAFAHLAGVVRVIDVPRAADGQVLRVLMNADLEEAVGFLAPPGAGAPPAVARAAAQQRAGDDHWRWRIRMAERIASELDAERFGVRALYVYGSAKNATAGPSSDLDLLVHFAGTPEQRRDLLSWLDGWSLALAEMNFLRTGCRRTSLLDVRLVDDAEIAAQTSYASKIGAITDAARPLPLRGQAPDAGPERA
jgi:predicted nucleotidyltransferase